MAQGLGGIAAALFAIFLLWYVVFRKPKWERSVGHANDNGATDSLAAHARDLPTIVYHDERHLSDARDALRSVGLEVSDMLDTRWVRDGEASNDGLHHFTGDGVVYSFRGYDVAHLLRTDRSATLFMRLGDTLAGHCWVVIDTTPNAPEHVLRLKSQLNNWLMCA